MERWGDQVKDIMLMKIKEESRVGIKTKAALLTGPYDIELVEKELVCGEDEVIVRNHLMGICGSDKNFYRGYLPPKTAEFRQEPKFPFF